MDVKRAIELIAGVTYKPEWSFEATDFTNRYASCVLLTCYYHVPDTNKAYAPEYATKITVYTNWPIFVGDCDESELYRRIFRTIMEIEFHESREFFSVNGNEFAKPYHPHNREGMLGWARYNGARTPQQVKDYIHHDLNFGSSFPRDIAGVVNAERVRGK